MIDLRVQTLEECRLLRNAFAYQVKSSSSTEMKYAGYGVITSRACAAAFRAARRYKDPEYLKKIAGDLYGGALRDTPDLLGRHLRHIKWSSDYGYYLQLFASFGWSSLPWLPFLSQPTLVMAGSDDPIVPAVNGRILAKLIPGARFVTVDDGHLFLLTSAKTSAEVIADFLN